MPATTMSLSGGGSGLQLDEADLAEVNFLIRPVGESPSAFARQQQQQHQQHGGGRPTHRHAGSNLSLSFGSFDSNLSAGSGGGGGGGGGAHAPNASPALTMRARATGGRGAKQQAKFGGGTPLRKGHSNHASTDAIAIDDL
jgi:hypothetical protein